jgi:hypothetical protein
MNRTAEFILGLVGGIIATVVGVVLLLFSVASGYASLGSLPGNGGVNGPPAIYFCIILIVFALIGLAGAVFTRKKPGTAGILMIVSGILSLAASGFPWSFIWSTELIVAGVMACIPKTAVPAGQVLDSDANVF